MNRPRFDTYSKAVLTVIAACLVWLCLDRTQIVPQADAQVKPGNADKVHDVVKARKFLVVDKKGRTRAIFDAFVGEPRIMFLDEREQERALWKVGKDSSSFSITEGDGTFRAILNVTKAYSMFWLSERYSVSSEKEPATARLVVGKDGPLFELIDEKTKGSVNLAIEKNGPVLELKDKKGHKRAVLGVTDLETSEAGEARKTTESSIVLFDKNGKVLWQAPPR